MLLGIKKTNKQISLKSILNGKNKSDEYCLMKWENKILITLYLLYNINIKILKKVIYHSYEKSTTEVPSQQLHLLYEIYMEM